MRIGLMGGTGKLGLGLALRLAAAGFVVLIGSRSPERAERAKRRVEEELRSRGLGAELGSGFNGDVAEDSDVVVLSVPLEGLDTVLDQIGGRVRPGATVVCPVVPIAWREGRPVYLDRPYGHSIAEHVASRLPQARVVAAFHTVSYRLLRDLDARVEGDVLVCGDDEGAKAVVYKLVKAVPNLRPLDGGPLANSKFVEDLAYLVVYVGWRTGKPDLGVRLV